MTSLPKSRQVATRSAPPLTGSSCAWQHACDTGSASQACPCKGQGPKHVELAQSLRLTNLTHGISLQPLVLMAAPMSTYRH